jgi:hypothetical protein
MTPAGRRTLSGLIALSAVAAALPVGDALAANRVNSTEASNAIRQKCFQEVQERYPSWNQDVKRSRALTYAECARRNGLRP